MYKRQLQYNDKFVLVHRLSHKIDGDTWGLPGGKVEKDESDMDAIRRELFEETGYSAQDHELNKLNEHDFVSPRGDTFTYVTFQVLLDNHHDVIIETGAHSEYAWVTVDEADSMDNLIHGLHDLFRIIQFIK